MFSKMNLILAFLLFFSAGMTQAVKMITLDRFSSTDCNPSNKIATQFYAVSGVCRQLGQTASFRITCGAGREVFLNSNKCEGTPNVAVQTNLEGNCFPALLTSFQYSCQDVANVLELQYKVGNCSAAVSSYNVYVAPGVCTGFSATFNDISFGSSWKVDQTGTSLTISTFNNGNCSPPARSFGTVAISGSGSCSNGAPTATPTSPSSDSVNVVALGGASIARIGTFALLVALSATFLLA
jgi:hypothetical protein